MKVTLNDLEFESGRLVKVRGMRPEYMSGGKLIDIVRELASLLADPVMPDLPIEFTDSEVRAILREIENARTGKTQMRQALKPQPNLLNGGKPLNNGRGSYSVKGGWKRILAPGDRLWVRESWSIPDAYLDGRKPELVIYGATPWAHPGAWRPSIIMPRWASRITLIVTDVRVQRLQDISAKDAEAEGWPTPEDRAESGIAEIRDTYPIGWYAALWESLHGTGSWDANPWVMACTFHPILGNIDRIGSGNGA